MRIIRNSVNKFIVFCIKKIEIEIIINKLNNYVYWKANICIDV